MLVLSMNKILFLSFCVFYLYSNAYIISRQKYLVRSRRRFSVWFSAAEQQVSSTTSPSSTNQNDNNNVVLNSSNNFISSLNLTNNIKISNETNTLQLKEKLLNGIRDPQSRLQSLQTLLELHSFKFTHAECKTLIVACIFTKSEDFMTKLLFQLKEQNKITSELLFVGVRTACRRRSVRLAYLILMEARNNPKLMVDIESVNIVLSLLSMQSQIQYAKNILVMVANKELGEGLSPDMSTYSRVISCACKTQNSEILVNIFQLLQNDTTVRVEASLFLDTLKFCSLTGFYRAAQEVLKSYMRLFKYIKPQAYSLLIMAYNVFRKDIIEMGEKSPVKLDLGSIPRHPLDSLLATMNETMNDEHYPELYNQILQYYCIENKLDDAFNYFNGLRHRNASFSFSASTMLAYSNLLRRNKDNEKVNSLVQYYKSRNIETTTMLSRINGNQRHIVTEVEDAVATLRKYLSTDQYTKVRIEFVYYILAQAIAEKKFFTAVSFFLDYLTAFKTAEHISDITVFSGCVEQILCRIPYRISYKAFDPIIEFLKTIDENLYDRHILERSIRNNDANSSIVVIPEPFSRIRLSSGFIYQDLPYSVFMNMQYLVLIDTLFLEGQYESIDNVTCFLNIQDNISELVLQELVSTVLKTSININPQVLQSNKTDESFVKGIVPGYIMTETSFTESWERFSNAVISLLTSLRSQGYKPSEPIYSVIIRRMCNRNNPLPYSPSLTSYNGDFDLLAPEDIPDCHIDVEVIKDMVEEDGLQDSHVLQDEILAALLSYAKIYPEDRRATDYFLALSKQYQQQQQEDEGGIVSNRTAELRRLYEESSLGDASGSQLADNESGSACSLGEGEMSGKVSLQAKLLKRGSGSAGSGGAAADNSSATAAKLYSKVLETLLRAHRSEEAKSLLTLMLSKNISSKPEEIYVLMGHELKAGNAAGAIEIFTAFFHMPGSPSSAPPDSRSVSLLAVALSKTKSMDLGATLAMEILPFILTQKMQLSVPVCEAYFSFCMHKKNAVTACEYILLIPPLQRKVLALASISKLCALTGQVDLLNKLRSEHVFPFEVICHHCAGYALKGLWKKAFNFEYFLRKASISRQISIPFWVKTFLLYAAAAGGKWDNAHRIILEKDVHHSELDYNLALYAGLKYALSMSKFGETESIKEKRINDIISLLNEMKKLNYQIHPSIRAIGDMLLRLGQLGVEDVMTELNSFGMTEHPRVTIESGSISGEGGIEGKAQKISMDSYTPAEVENLRLMDTYHLSMQTISKMK